MYNAALVQKEKEKDILEERVQGPNITNIDRLRFVEAMLHNAMKLLYRSSQDLMTRSATENRNSIMKVLDFYDTITKVFNNPSFKPETSLF